MGTPLESFVNQLSSSGIVAPGRLERFLPPHGSPSDMGELVDSLVKQGLLTQFQARHIKAGKLKALVLGSYTLLDTLGVGGMGQVFKAEHRRMKRLVAVKMLPARFMKDAAAVARFEREVEAAAKLEHPNIVTAYDADQAGNTHFLVMQFVDGIDLSALVKKQGPLPANKAVEYLLQAARGLKFAHDKGVVHRDVKPANLLLGKDGVVRILDMGLARIEVNSEASTQAELTDTGAVMGTADYMAPDQAIDIRRADARADIYSLGCTLYYLIVGKPMYDAPSLMGKLLAHRDQPIPSLLQTQPTVPPQLDIIYRKMVAKEVAERYQSMSEIIEALEGLGLAAAAGNRIAERGSAITLTIEERQILATKPSKPPLGSLGQAVASEKTKHLLAKVMGGVFATIIAPILVTYLIKYLEGEDSPSAPNAAASASASPDDNRENAAAEAKVSAPATIAYGQSPTDNGAQPGNKTRWQGWPVEAPPPAVAPFDADQALKHQDAWARFLGVPVEYQNSLGMKFRLIPPGEFIMGTPPEETKRLLQQAENAGPWLADALRSEGPPRPVVVRQPFYLGAVEVTNDQFAAFVEATGYQTADERSGLGGDSYEDGKGIVRRPEKVWRALNLPGKGNHPVGYLVTSDAEAFCKWLSEKCEAHYELPSEEEWEYACRAGTSDERYCPADRLAEFIQDTRELAVVREKLPNSFGLFDMLGNQEEIAYARTGPVVRGGSGKLNDLGLVTSRCAFREPIWENGEVGALFQGFRVAIVGDLKALVAPLRGNEPWTSPAFEYWVTETQSLPATGQLQAVASKLQELNPVFDGKLTGFDSGFKDDSKRSSNGGLGKSTPSIEQGAVTAIGLCTDNVHDISPLRALRQLKRLSCTGSEVRGMLADLSPLQGLSLSELNCFNNLVEDLSKLLGLPIESLSIGNTRVRNLAPLGKLPLKRLGCGAMPLTSLEGLRGMRLTELRCPNTAVSDLTPLEGMPLAYLECYYTRISNLAPLRGMPLEVLHCFGLSISDLSPLAGMPLKRAHFDGSRVADVTPLESCKNLSYLSLHDTKVTAAALKVLRKALPDCKILCRNPLPSPPAEGTE